MEGNHNGIVDDEENVLDEYEEDDQDNEDGDEDDIEDQIMHKDIVYDNLDEDEDMSSGEICNQRKLASYSQEYAQVTTI